jgi:hypothetical protein
LPALDFDTDPDFDVEGGIPKVELRSASRVPAQGSSIRNFQKNSMTPDAQTSGPYGICGLLNPFFSQKMAWKAINDAQVVFYALPFACQPQYFVECY